ncbi:50S ribosomal protein L22 [Candidatus Woesearchaeota archaeon]|nr:50S ribosomal protein L22 [Candidatus Woesearchaeota archaeon]
MANTINTASLNVKGLPISTKMSVEICNLIRNKSLLSARRILQDVVTMKRPIPIRRFNADLAHKPGMAAGRYPISASKVFLGLLDSVEANAENKGLNVNNLLVVFAKADKGDARRRYGRKGGVKMKNTHVSLVVEEKTDTKELKND